MNGKILGKKHKNNNIGLPSHKTNQISNLFLFSISISFHSLFERRQRRGRQSICIRGCCRFIGYYLFIFIDTPITCGCAILVCHLKWNTFIQSISNVPNATVFARINYTLQSESILRSRSRSRERWWWNHIYIKMWWETLCSEQFCFTFAMCVGEHLHTYWISAILDMKKTVVWVVSTYNL